MEGGGQSKKIDIGEKFLQYNKSNKKQIGSSHARISKGDISKLRPLTVKELLLEKLKKYKKEKSRKKRNLEANAKPSLSSYQLPETSMRSLTTNFSQHSKQKPKIQIPETNRDYGRTMLEPRDNHINKVPPDYGNLKNGIKPTYRQFLKNKTMRKELPKSRRKVEVEVEKKFALGRNHTQKKVGVFIKSNEMRRTINDKKVDMQRSELRTVKNYLKTQNLIRYGSDAPNELLREIYMDSKMCGDVFNINGKSLVHNYMNE